MTLPTITKNWFIYGDGVPIIKILQRFYGKLSKKLSQKLMKTLLKFVAAFLVVLLVVMFVSPYYQLYRFKNAYEQNDYALIIASIDYETFRPNLKQQLHTKIATTISQQGLALFLPMLGVPQKELENFAIRFVDGAVDKAITPDNLTKLAQGDITKDSEPLLLGLIFWLGGDLVDVGALMQDYLATGDMHHAIARQETLIKQNAKHLNIKPAAFDVGYCGMNCFFVKTAIKNQPITIKMSRHQWVMWQIDEVVLP
ncbi:DUF2939 domain-containing protein [Moraxella sp. VT-16-12]|nr:DUF2939 domain-containing protein [Moraxella sp. VT-16-12]